MPKFPARCKIFFQIYESETGFRNIAGFDKRWLANYLTIKFVNSTKY